MTWSYKWSKGNSSYWPDKGKTMSLSNEVGVHGI
jgi:hypothetical protein